MEVTLDDGGPFGLRVPVQGGTVYNVYPVGAGEHTLAINVRSGSVTTVNLNEDIVPRELGELDLDRNAACVGSGVSRQSQGFIRRTERVMGASGGPAMDSGRAR